MRMRIYTHNLVNLGSIASCKSQQNVRLDLFSVNSYKFWHLNKPFFASDPVHNLFWEVLILDNQREFRGGAFYRNRNSLRCVAIWVINQQIYLKRLLDSRWQLICFQFDYFLSRGQCVDDNKFRDGLSIAHFERILKWLLILHLFHCFE